MKTVTHVVKVENKFHVVSVGETIAKYNFEKTANMVSGLLNSRLAKYLETGEITINPVVDHQDVANMLLNMIYIECTFKHDVTK